MDSLRLGLLAVIPMDPVEEWRARHCQERLDCKARQREVLSWIANKKLRHQDIAAALGVHPANVTGVLNGRTQLPGAWVTPLAALLEVTADELRRAWRPWLKRRQPRPVLSTQEQHTRQVVSELLAERRIRQADLARALGVRQGEVSLALHGSRRIPSSWHEPIVAFFGIPLHQLATNTEPDGGAVAKRPAAKPKRLRNTRPRIADTDERIRRMIVDLKSRRGISQQQMARALGVCQSVISDALCAKRSIPERWYSRLADLFNVPLDAFGQA